MRKIAFVFLVFLAPMLAFAQATAPVPVPGFEWVAAVISFVAQIPTVGPILSVVFQIVAIVAGVMTALSIFVQSVLTLPALVAKWSGASALEEKIKAISDKVLPWLKYLSIFNVQKPQ